MQGVIRAALGGVLALGALGWAGAATAQSEAEGPYLQGPQGPYRGRIVDTVTGQPLAEAVVVIFWEQLDSQIPGHTTTIAAREALTDAAGGFVLDASAIEGTLPPRTLPPRVLIFKPGYATFPRKFGSPPGAPAAPFTGSGTTVMLTPVSDPEDRVEYFNIFMASLKAAWGFPTPRDPGPLPETARLTFQELKHFGVALPAPQNAPR